MSFKATLVHGVTSWVLLAEHRKAMPSQFNQQLQNMAGRPVTLSHWCPYCQILPKWEETGVPRHLRWGREDTCSAPWITEKNQCYSWQSLSFQAIPGNICHVATSIPIVASWNVHRMQRASAEQKAGWWQKPKGYIRREITQASGPHCVPLKYFTKCDFPSVEKRQIKQGTHSRRRLGLQKLCRKLRRKRASTLPSSHSGQGNAS